MPHAYTPTLALVGDGSDIRDSDSDNARFGTSEMMCNVCFDNNREKRLHRIGKHIHIPMYLIEIASELLFFCCSYAAC